VIEPIGSPYCFLCGSVRIYDDYNVTINQASQIDSYPCLKIDCFASLAGENRFTNLDLAIAQQKTHQRSLWLSAYQYTIQYSRLSFDVSAAPSILF